MKMRIHKDTCNKIIMMDGCWYGKISQILG